MTEEHVMEKKERIEKKTSPKKEKNRPPLNRIAVLTSGGDCSGMNACIRSIARTALCRGIEVYGFRKGYQGVMNNDYINLDNRSVSGKIGRGGTFLQSARCLEFKTPEGLQEGYDNLIDLGIDGLVVIGGDGSLTGAQKLHEKGFPVVGIPASIDNDLYGTDMSIGTDTALNAIVNAIDMIRDTASSHDRMFIIEVMGRNCGYLALASAIACGAEAAIIPERPYDLNAIGKRLKRRFKEKKTNSIIIVAEGAATATGIAAKLKGKVGYDMRVSVLGHIQRGGNATVFDRILASKLGRNAVTTLEEGESGIMMAFSRGRYATVPLSEVISHQRPLSRGLLDLAGLLET